MMSALALDEPNFDEIEFFKFEGERDRILDRLHVLVERAKRAGFVKWGNGDVAAAKQMNAQGLISPNDQALIEWAIPGIFDRPSRTQVGPFDREDQ